MAKRQVAKVQCSPFAVRVNMVLNLSVVIIVINNNYNNIDNNNYNNNNNNNNTREKGIGMHFVCTYMYPVVFNFTCRPVYYSDQCQISTLAYCQCKFILGSNRKCPPFYVDSLKVYVHLCGFRHFCFCFGMVYLLNELF